MNQQPVMPLEAMRIYEAAADDAASLARVAVAFAGQLAVRMGAGVTRIESAAGEPMRDWPPHDAQGSTLYRFLTMGKRIVHSLPPPAGAFLLTDSEALAADWPADRSVLVRAGPSGRPHSELTVMAETGLLDIFAGADRKPLPLPGHQLAYATGMAAFNALLGLRLAAGRPGAAARAEVSVLDVALWINWKHVLAAATDAAVPGVGREEEWTTLPCADGYVTLVFQDKDVPRLAELTGDEFFRDPALRSRAGRKGRLAEFRSRLAAWLAGSTRAQVVEMAQRARVPIGPVLGLDELAGDPQFEHVGFLAARGGAVQLRLPMLWNGRPLPLPPLRPAGEAA
jgi:Predicted acyl-CoA transferases/carnitine dehydratase